MPEPNAMHLARRDALIFLTAAVATGGQSSAIAQIASHKAQTVRQVLNQSRLDYLQCKLVLDRVIDPSLDNIAITQTVERMAAIVRQLAGAGADDIRKLTAVRQLIY